MRSAFRHDTDGACSLGGGGATFFGDCLEMTMRPLKGEAAGALREEGGVMSP